VKLDNASVLNGQVNMQLGASTSLSVENIDFKIRSNRLLKSTTKEGLRSAVDHLSFAKGVLRLKDLTARLDSASFTGNNLLYADKAAISTKGNEIAATVNKVYIDNLQTDDNSDNIEVDGLGWESATVALKAGGTNNNKNKSNRSSIYLKNIAGNNTQLTFSGKPA
jgi:hypothetical protein